MAAVWSRLRADARTRWRSWVILALLGGFAGGVVMACVAAGRRADSAFDRFRRWSNSADVQVFTGVAPLNVEAVRELPEVGRAVEGRFVWTVGEDGESYLDPVYTFGPGFAEVDRPKVLAGRSPDPERADEAAIGPVAARTTNLSVGSTVTLRSLTPEQLETAFGGGNPEPAGPTITVRIVGIEAIQTEFLEDASLHLTPAFGRLYGDRVATIPTLAVKLKRGVADVDAFTAGVQRVSPGVQYDVSADVAAEVDRSVHIQAVALRLFAALAGLAAVVILSQALAREVFFHRADDDVLRSLGMGRPQLLAVAALRAAAIALLGATVAVATAIAASSFLPVGLAREVDPSPGMAVDVATLSLGALAFMVLTAVAGTAPAWRSMRRGDAEAKPLAGTWSVGTAARLGASPSAVAGVRMAFQRGGGRSAVPSGATLVGTILSLTALTAALVFGASLQHLFGTPTLYGWNWDAIVGSPFDDDVTDEAVPALAESPAVDAFSAVSFSEVTVNGVSVRLWDSTPSGATCCLRSSTGGRLRGRTRS